MSARPRERFEELAELPDSRLNLAEAALVIASEGYPDLSIHYYLAKLDALAQEADAYIAGAREGSEQIAALNDFLYGERKFAGNHAHYYDPRNSFLNEVIDRRNGIPITLAIVYIEVAQRVGLPVVGVSFPGHFLVKYIGDEEILVDPFAGELITEDDCQELLEATVGPDIPFDPDYLEAASNREIIVRMLNNLKHIYINKENFEAALGCCDRVLVLLPEHPLELRDRGYVYQQLECFTAALSDFERFVELASEDVSTNSVDETIQELRRRVAQIH